ncbi:contractile injection system tape measure protein [Ferribacterium limneticum]|uniref:contractile injection system tape measure protein n=1 Tax=Ferribacterium limneticum TaxID=76259 RepID=UPI001CF951C7|nr:contractile injection system tape measure protein [Ferribacterium limneticum]UCV27911.1 hypothetical protein KI617_16950 [Ferribacterium limneticum]UCV31828.1 hypothetical protein KI608_16950 [Ferribacterium limneticum]
MSATHRIRRQRWQVRTASPADAFAVRTALRQENELSLLPALESAFAALDNGEREIHLPRLELAIRISSPERLAEELPARLAEAARQALAEAVEASPSGPAAIPRSLTPGDRLRRYLGSGQVDWFDADREQSELQQQLAEEARQWSASPAAAWPCLMADLPAGGEARADAFFRFLQLLDVADRLRWWDFAARLAEAHDGESPARLGMLRQMAATRPADHALRLQALGLLALSADSARSSGHRSECLRVAQTCAGQLETFAVVDRKNWLKIESWLGGESGLPTLDPDTSGRSTATNELSQPAPDAGRFEKSANFSVDREQALGLPLRSAGLILLHPYLPRLFAALGWISASHPPGEPFPWARLPHAAALLNWLATGRDEPFEFELGTAKLLLGLPPDTPLPVAAGLIGDAEREEGEALLGAVVQHWSALGQTSIDGLRVAFLQRGGLLYPAPDGWLLRPQGETFDLLLDRLPWGLSIIRLPWMPGCLHTEWLST